LLFPHLRKEIVPKPWPELLFTLSKQISVNPVRLVAAKVGGEGLTGGQVTLVGLVLLLLGYRGNQQ
jgi:hypothetical protein